MIWRNSTEQYGALSIGLHWLMLLVLAAVYASIEVRELFPQGSTSREKLKDWHFALGLSVFGLVWLRLLLRLTSPRPQVEADMPDWQRLSSTLMQCALYALMIGMPLAGWLTLGAMGRSIPFFGLQVPALIAENRGIAELVKGIHEAGGTIGYFLIVVHAIAALFHHYIVRDSTLLKMLPSRK